MKKGSKELDSGGEREAWRRYLAAAVPALPTGMVIWLELLYLGSGIMEFFTVPALGVILLLVSFGLAFCWPLYRTGNPAEVAYRSCRLGIAVSLLLPIVSVLVLLVYWFASELKSTGVGAMTLYVIPLISVGAALVLTVLFSFGSRYFARKLEG